MRACAYTVTAPDTFSVIRSLMDGHIHFTNLRAGTTTGTFIFINMELIKRQPIKQGIESTQWTYPFAKRPVKKDGQNYNSDQYTAFPCE